MYLVFLLEEARLLVVGVQHSDRYGGLCRGGGGRRPSAVDGLDSDEVSVDPLPVDEAAVGDADLAADRVEAEGGDDGVVARQARVAHLAVGGRQVGIGGVYLNDAVIG